MITEKQHSAIETIENTLNIKFTGKTKGDATTFITMYMEVSKQQAFENECNSYGLPNQ